MSKLRLRTGLGRNSGRTGLGPALVGEPARIVRSQTGSPCEAGHTTAVTSSLWSCDDQAHSAQSGSRDLG